MTNPSGEFLLIRTECLICGRNVCHILHRKGDLPDRHEGHLVQVSNPTNRFRDRLSKWIKADSIAEIYTEREVVQAA
ncbi:hypothetical protein ILYODFUR_003884 [Ilyodon furcidens]|uniref:HNH endonuclease n=1 Tax=Ilyodon furcidens TaxID=33524 RepID=A0ABV0UEF9_9TELE